MRKDPAAFFRFAGKRFSLLEKLFYTDRGFSDGELYSLLMEHLAEDDPSASYLIPALHEKGDDTVKQVLNILLKNNRALEQEILLTLDTFTLMYCSDTSPWCAWSIHLSFSWRHENDHSRVISRFSMYSMPELWKRS